MSGDRNVVHAAIVRTRSVFAQRGAIMVCPLFARKPRGHEGLQLLGILEPIRICFGVGWVEAADEGTQTTAGKCSRKSGNNDFGGKVPLLAGKQKAFKQNGVVDEQRKEVCVVLLCAGSVRKIPVRSVIGLDNG